MLLPILLSLSLQTDTWSGIDVTKVYETDRHPKLLLAFELQSRRALLTLNAQDGTPLGKNVGYIANATPVNPLEGDYAIDVVWDASRSNVFTGQSLVIIDDGSVSLDAEHSFEPSEAHDLQAHLALFPDDQVEASEAETSGLEPLGMYGQMERTLLVLPHGRQVVYARGQNTVTRGWVLPPRGGGWRLLWETPENAPGDALLSDFRVDSGGDCAMRSGFVATNYRKHLFGNSQRGAEVDQQWNARRSQLLEWSKTIQERAEYWNGWSVTGVYHRVPFQFADEYIWVDPKTETLYKVGLSSGQLLADRTARGKIVQSGIRRLNGNYLTDVIWEGGAGGTTYESAGEVASVAPIGTLDYKLSDKKTQEELARFLETALPQAHVDIEWPWPEPGAIYRGGQDGAGHAYICVLENGRDVLIGSKRQCYLTVLTMAYETGLNGERCLSFVGNRDRHVWQLNDAGNIIDNWRSEHHLPGGAPFEKTTEYDFVVDNLKQMYGFWTHPKKE